MGCKSSRAIVLESDFTDRAERNFYGVRSDRRNAATNEIGGHGRDDLDDMAVGTSSDPLALDPLALHPNALRGMTRGRLSRRGVDYNRFDPIDAGADNLDQLRSEMLTLERMFQTLLESQLNGTPSPTRNSSYPPASPHIIENLPTIVVSNHDFEDGCNKECSICFLEFNVNDTVSRLPCGHFFHGECINEWLQKKCTCPICRWELETEDRLFEIDRIERMKSRRIRVKDHELDRLSIEGLQEMAGTKSVKNRAKLIKTIKSLNNVDVITQSKNLVCKMVDYDGEEKQEIGSVVKATTTSI